MPYGLYISAAGADAQSRRLQVLAHNLANVGTPGFKRELAVLQARYAEAVERGEQPPGAGGVEDVGGGVRLPETLTSFAAGPMKQTGVATDLAIAREDAFFVVEKEGQPLLTRAGDFRFSSDGRLQTPQGYAVLNENSEPLTIDPSLPWRVLENGVVEQAGNGAAVKLVIPQSLGDLVRVGENLFSPLAPTLPVPPATRQVLSGYLEQSAVKPTLEMMELIEASRAYEANVRMIQNQDHMIGTLVSRVLRSS